MSGRERDLTATCTWHGCNEHGYLAYANQREYAEAWKRAKRWRCARHRNDGTDVLTEESGPRGATLVVVEHSYGRFWYPDGAGVGGSGVSTGPGFQAWAKDFPPGTRLTVSADVALPIPTAAAGDRQPTPQEGQ